MLEISSAHKNVFVGATISQPDWQNENSYYFFENALDIWTIFEHGKETNVVNFCYTLDEINAARRGLDK